jgi:capsular polysaccharide biosynthesis protein/Mrp family chromosome partitioning ATPase
MDIRRYFQVPWRRKSVVLITLLATLAVVAAGIHITAPVYSASAIVRIAEVRTGPAAYSDITYSQQLQNTYVQLLQSRPSLDSVIQKLGLNVKPQTLAGMIKVEALAATELIRVTANGGNAEQAAAIANSLAVLATEEVPTSYSITVVAPAVAPDAPSRPQPTLYMLLAAVVGLVGGLGLAFLFENLDTTIRTVDDLGRPAGAPLLGSIPRFRVKRRQRGQPILLDGTDGTPAVEAIRVLSANTTARVSRRVLPGHSASILVASPESGEGRSTVLANLAAIMAREGQRVIVVGTNLLHPDLSRVFGVSDGVSQGEVLGDPLDALTLLVHTGIPDVRLLPASALSATLDLPTAIWMRELIETLAQKADVVLLDSPAILSSADATMLAPLVDGVLLVVARGKTTDRSLELARAQIDAVGGRILGIVFNRAEIPGNGNIYAGPVGGWMPAANGHDARARAALPRVTAVEARRALERTTQNHENHEERIKKAV